MIETTREQYIVAQIFIAALRAANSLHCGSETEKESVNEDVNCIENIAFEIAKLAGEGVNSKVNCINQAIEILERARVASICGQRLVQSGESK